MTGRYAKQEENIDVSRSTCQCVVDVGYVVSKYCGPWLTATLTRWVGWTQEIMQYWCYTHCLVLKYIV